MKPKRPSRFKLLLTTVFLATASVHATDALAPAPGYAPSLTFTAKRTEQVVVKSDPDDASIQYPEVAAVDTTNLVVVANITGIASASINADTPFSLSLGNLVVQGTLGDDPAFVAGKTSAFFPTHGWDANNQPVGTEGMSLSWTATRLTVKLVNSANSPADEGRYVPAFSSNYAGETNPSVRALSSLTLSFGDCEGDIPVFIKGTAVTTSQPYTASGVSDTQDITQTNLSGAVDLTAPTVALGGTTLQSDGSALLKGTATDGFGLESLQITTTPDDASSWQPLEVGSVAPLPEAEDDWGGGTTTWSYVLPETGIGTTSFCVRAHDLGGNTSAVTIFKVQKTMPGALTGRWDSLLTVGQHAPAITGTLTFNCSAVGVLTGKINLSGRSYSFNGTWSDGHVHARAPRGAGKKALLIDADCGDLSAESPQGAWLGGRITEEGVPVSYDEELDEETGVLAYIGAFRSPYSASKRPDASVTGSYNSRLLGTDVVGTSVFSVNIAAAGGVQVTGKLADGTAVSWSGVLGAGGQVPFYNSLYGGKGFIGARFGVDGFWCGADVASWSRPANYGKGFADGFTLGSLSVQGQRYVAPAKGAMPLDLAAEANNALLEIDGWAAVSTWCTVDSRGRVSFDAPPPGLKSLINLATGTVTGSVKLTDGSNKIVPISGLVIGNEAFGSYVTSNLNAPATFGSMHLIPPAPPEESLVEDPGVDEPVVEDPAQ